MLRGAGMASRPAHRPREDRRRFVPAPYTGREQQEWWDLLRNFRETQAVLEHTVRRALLAEERVRVLTGKLEEEEMANDGHTQLLRERTASLDEEKAVCQRFRHLADVLLRDKAKATAAAARGNNNNNINNNRALDRLLPHGDNTRGGALRFHEMQDRWEAGMLREIFLERQQQQQQQQQGVASECARELAANGLSEPVESRFEGMLVLGEGGFGVVRQGQCRKSKKVFAVKTVKGGNDPTMLQRELMAFAIIKPHDNVVSVACLNDMPNREGIVMEVAVCDLHQAVTGTSAVKFTLAQQIWFEAGAVRGLQHFHESGMIFCDYKMSNTLICRSDGPERFVGKITDPGLWCGTGDTKFLQMGTVGRVPLENQFAEVEAAEPQDVFAIGAELCLLLARRDLQTETDVMWTHSCVTTSAEKDELNALLRSGGDSYAFLTQVTQRTMVDGSFVRIFLQPSNLNQALPPEDLPKVCDFIRRSISNDPSERPSTHKIASFLTKLAADTADRPGEPLDGTADGAAAAASPTTASPAAVRMPSADEARPVVVEEVAEEVIATPVPAARTPPVELRGDDGDDNDGGDTGNGEAIGGVVEGVRYDRLPSTESLRVGFVNDGGVLPRPEAELADPGVRAVVPPATVAAGVGGPPLPAAQSLEAFPGRMHEGGVAGDYPVAGPPAPEGEEAAAGGEDTLAFERILRSEFSHAVLTAMPEEELGAGAAPTITSVLAGGFTVSHPHHQAGLSQASHERPFRASRAARIPMHPVGNGRRSTRGGFVNGGGARPRLEETDRLLHPGERAVLPPATVAAGRGGQPLTAAQWLETLPGRILEDGVAGRNPVAGPPAAEEEEAAASGEDTLPAVRSVPPTVAPDGREENLDVGAAPTIANILAGGFTDPRRHRQAGYSSTSRERPSRSVRAAGLEMHSVGRDRRNAPPGYRASLLPIAPIRDAMHPAGRRIAPPGYHATTPPTPLTRTAVNPVGHGRRIVRAG